MTKNRVLRVVLAVALVCVLMPQAVWAEKGEAVEMPADGVSIASGYYHKLVVKQDGSLWAWGDNSNGQLLFPELENRDWTNPVKIADNITSVAAGGWYSLAIDFQGQLIGWGVSRRGLLNRQGVYDSPVVYASANPQCGVRVGADGGLSGWGYMYFGDGKENRVEDAPVEIMGDVRRADVGKNFVVVIKRDGSLWAWGENDCGQLGDGTHVNRLSPVKIMDGVESVSVEDMGTIVLAVKKDGTLWAWGDFSYGKEFGDKPQKIAEDVTYAATCSLRYMYIKKDGSLWAWGYNDEGQAGDGTTGNVEKPVKIMENVVSLALSAGDTMALKSDGTLWFWGAKKFAYYDETAEIILTPIKIMDGVKLPNEPIRKTASPTDIKINIGGKDAPVDSCVIGGQMYVRLRSLAYYLKGAPIGFNVRETEDGDVIMLSSFFFGDYETVGGERLVKVKKGSEDAKPMIVRVYNSAGRRVDVDVCYVYGDYYYRLSDVAAVMGFKCRFDAKTNTTYLTDK